MKKSSLFTILGLIFLCTVTALEAKPHLEFDGTNYYRAFEEGGGKGNDMLIEFLPKGESLDHWNRMLSIRLFSKLKDPDSYLSDMEDSVKKSSPHAMAVVYKEEHMIDFLVYSDDGDMAEFNIMKASYVKGEGLYVEQLAWRNYHLQQKTIEEARAMGEKNKALRERLIPLFYEYNFTELGQ